MDNSVPELDLEGGSTSAPPTSSPNAQMNIPTSDNAPMDLSLGIGPLTSPTGNSSTTSEDNEVTPDITIPNVEPGLSDLNTDLAEDSPSAGGNTVAQLKADSRRSSYAEDSTMDIESNISSTKGKGQSLPQSTQQELGGRMGADFSNVNIHTDSNAIQMSTELDAKAFTVGNDIYFNKGNYSPESPEGKHLLAHELTHTIQQGNNSIRRVQRAKIDRANLSKSDLNREDVKKRLSYFSKGTEGTVGRRVQVSIAYQEAKDKAVKEKLYSVMHEANPYMSYLGNVYTVNSKEGDFFRAVYEKSGTEGNYTFKQKKAPKKITTYDWIKDKIPAGSTIKVIRKTTYKKTEIALVKVTAVKDSVTSTPKKEWLYNDKSTGKWVGSYFWTTATNVSTGKNKFFIQHQNCKNNL